MLDEAIALFTRRLSENAEVEDRNLPFERVLAAVVHQLRARLSQDVGFTSELPKHGYAVMHSKSEVTDIDPTMSLCVQAHWPGEHGGAGIGPIWRGADNPMQECSTPQQLLQYLIESIDSTAADFAKFIHENNIKRLHTMELPTWGNVPPSLCCGALWNAPVRLIWTYNINYDAIIARYDIIGSE
jgi:hypothetical protein